MRITKYMAEEASKQLVKKKKEELDKKQSLLFKSLYEYLKPKCNKDALKLLKDESTKGLICSTSSVRIVSGCGFSYDYIYLSESLPHWNGNTFQIEFESKDPKGIEFYSLFNEVTSLKSDVKKLEQDITTALVNLKTLKRVSVEFPEALEFLPKSETTAICVNIKPIREKLK